MKLYLKKIKFVYTLKPAAPEAFMKKVNILVLLNTNFNTRENKKVEVFVHFSTIVKLDLNAGSVTVAVPCGWCS